MPSKTPPRCALWATLSNGTTVPNRDNPPTNQSKYFARILTGKKYIHVVTSRIGYSEQKIASIPQTPAEAPTTGMSGCPGRSRTLMTCISPPTMPDKRYSVRKRLEPRVSSTLRPKKYNAKQFNSTCHGQGQECMNWNVSNCQIRP